MPPSSNRPSGAPQVLPYLYYADAGAALAFLVSAFGFREIDAVRDDEGTVWHANLSTGDGIVMIGPGMPELGTGALTTPDVVTARTFVYVDDALAHFEQAVRAGARIVSELQEQGPNHVYIAADCGEHEWIFATPCDRSVTTG